MKITKTIVMPSSLELQTALTFSSNIATLEEADEYIFDFKNTRNTEPFGMLLVASQIRRLIRLRPKASVRCSNFKHMTYAAHMGFFQSFGLDHGKAPGEATGSSRYIPIRIFDCPSLEREAAQKGIEVGEEIEETSGQMASILCGESSGPIHETLTYSMREVMRNVIEHSESQRFGICAQYWPSKNRVEVALLDQGIGLRQSLSANPHIDTSNDRNAINYALMPAISGKAFKGARSKKKGPWANSGFGLYMTNRICRNGGNFFIATGNSGLLLTSGKEGKKWYDCNLIGTAIRMTVKTDQLPSLKESLSKYKKEGYEFQKRYREIVSIDPSAASLMLSEDFDVSTWQKIKARIGL
ncbi:hypothetical protein ACYT85_15230 [Ralstonia solanacearum]|uniref:hypothetical protein n=1 Tax=Ralstonia solanacearum TaxID=305 RepID=UPI000B2B0687|nr:hypothetical protein [Ralstonia solanacearum]MBB6591197.1 hypothetical protein [Ralstonia solanacearum]MBB6595391.1 hypothetical protein [Ralstonia solanacearum]MDB0541920.1 hypothetical protein [Ralstonia solanacearum]MDB0552278.1 hypothetical protein [Ralstonia solanacearum]MDB0556822.1 hypothetical protein [Ralstonia solanacearum]